MAQGETRSTFSLRRLQCCATVCDFIQTILLECIVTAVGAGVHKKTNKKGTKTGEFLCLRWKEKVTVPAYHALLFEKIKMQLRHRKRFAQCTEKVQLLIRPRRLPAGHCSTAGESAGAESNRTQILRTTDGGTPHEASRHARHPPAVKSLLCRRGYSHCLHLGSTQANKPS